MKSERLNKGEGGKRAPPFIPCNAEHAKVNNRILLSEEFVFVHYLYLLLYVTLPILIPHRTIIHKTSQLFQIKKAV